MSALKIQFVFRELRSGGIKNWHSRMGNKITNKVEKAKEKSICNRDSFNL